MKGDNINFKKIPAIIIVFLVAITISAQNPDGKSQNWAGSIKDVIVGLDGGNKCRIVLKEYPYALFYLNQEDAIKYGLIVKTENILNTSAADGRKVMIDVADSWIIGFEEFKNQQEAKTHVPSQSKSELDKSLFDAVEKGGLEKVKELIITRNGNLRSGSGTQHEIIGKVTSGMKVIQLENNDDWFKIKLPSQKTGWIHKILITDENKTAVNQSEVNKSNKKMVKDKSGLITSESQANEYVSTYKSSGLTMHAISGWTFMSPSEVRRKTNGNFEISSNTIFFVVNDIDVDANINVQYVGNFSSEAPNKEAAYRILQQLKSQVEPSMRQQFQGFKMIKSQLMDFAGGAALEIVYQFKRGETLLQQKQLTLISNKKAFTITCNAKKGFFDEYNLKGFEIILNSIKID